MVEELPVGVQQRVEILKALYREAEILILDEPTAVLTPQETEELFAVMRSLREAGKGIIFITHKLKEVLAIADRITVVRRGKIVGAADPKTATDEELAAMMVGRAVQLTVDKTTAQARPAGARGGRPEGARRARSRGRRRRQPRSSTPARSCASPACRATARPSSSRRSRGSCSPAEGAIRLQGNDITKSNANHVLDAGVGHVPEDRIRDGLVIEFSIADNMVLDTYDKPPFSRGFVRNEQAVLQAAEERARDFDVRTPSVSQPASTLSGGNQQKVIVAREFSRPISLLVASQPTRGLDVGSIEYIHRRIVQKRDEGTAVLIVSPELDEVLALADRILVMYRGRIVGNVPAAEATRERIGLLMAGVQDPPPEEDAASG